MSDIKLFESRQIRSVWSEDDQKWYFSVIDVVAALTDSPNPRDYWYRIKQREKISGIELSTICRQFKLQAPDGKRNIERFPDDFMFQLDAEDWANLKCQIGISSSPAPESGGRRSGAMRSQIVTAKQLVAEDTARKAQPKRRIGF